MKHELKIVELKLSLKKHGSKNESNLKFEIVNLRSQLSQVTSQLDYIKIEHAELEKYNIIVKGELTQSKQQIEKLYSSNDKLDEKMYVQRPRYDKNGLGYLLSQSAKKSNVRKEPDPKFDNANLRSQLSQVKFELDSIKIEHAKLEKYNIIVKGELTQRKQQLEKLYSSEKID